MPSFSTELTLLRDHIVKAYADAGDPPSALAEALGTNYQGAYSLIRTRTAKRTLTDGEKRLRARLRAYAKKHGHICITVSTEDL